MKSLLIFCFCFPNQVVAEGLEVEGPSELNLTRRLMVGDKLLKPSSVIYSTLQHTLLVALG